MKILRSSQYVSQEIRDFCIGACIVDDDMRNSGLECDTTELVSVLKEPINEKNSYLEKEVCENLLKILERLEPDAIAQHMTRMLNEDCRIYFAKLKAEEDIGEGNAKVMKVKVEDTKKRIDILRLCETKSMQNEESNLALDKYVAVVLAEDASFFEPPPIYNSVALVSEIYSDLLHQIGIYEWKINLDKEKPVTIYSSHGESETQNRLCQRDRQLVM